MCVDRKYPMKMCVNDVRNAVLRQINPHSIRYFVILTNNVPSIILPVKYMELYLLRNKVIGAAKIHLWAVVKKISPDGYHQAVIPDQKWHCFLCLGWLPFFFGRTFERINVEYYTPLPHTHIPLHFTNTQRKIFWQSAPSPHTPGGGDNAFFKNKEEITVQLII